MSKKKRLAAQVFFFLLQNPLIHNFFNGKIYQDKLKMLCTPGLNCYSCPAAAVSCPVGAMQLFLAGARHSISLFASGFLISVGVVFGRLICGYVCPMGLLQDLLYRIKTPKFVVRFRFARFVKYIVLIVFVITLPYAVRHELSGLGAPWFCKILCPSGTIFGAIPLLAGNNSLLEFAGAQLALKMSIAAGIVISAAIIYRPFCRILCPLGAFYSLFSKIAFLRMRCNKDKCTSCGSCAEVCDIKLNPAQNPNSPECVHCGNCVNACKARALRYLGY